MAGQPSVYRGPVAPEPWGGWGGSLEVDIPSVVGEQVSGQPAGGLASNSWPSVAPLPGLLWAWGCCTGCTQEAAVTGDGAAAAFREHLIAFHYRPRSPQHTPALQPQAPFSCRLRERSAWPAPCLGAAPASPIRRAEGPSPSPPRAGQLRLRRAGAAGSRGCTRTEWGPAPRSTALRARLGGCSSAWQLLRPCLLQTEVGERGAESAQRKGPGNPHSSPCRSTPPPPGPRAPSPSCSPDAETLVSALGSPTLSSQPLSSLQHLPFQGCSMIRLTRSVPRVHTWLCRPLRAGPRPHRHGGTPRRGRGGSGCWA